VQAKLGVSEAWCKRKNSAPPSPFGIQFGICPIIMRKVFGNILLLLFCVLSFRSIQAQSPQDVMKSIEAAIKNKDAVQLSQFFNKELEITLLDYEKVCSKSQAQLVVKDFFSKNPLSKFNLIHVGGSGDAWYGMGLYESVNSQFDTNVFIKKYGAVYLIDRIRFENKD
jgi:hypothetical protein